MTILEEINEVKKEEVKILRKNFTLSRFTDSEFFSKKRISLRRSLYNANRISIIAEIKKASPSRGIIREKFDHLSIAHIYMDGGAEAISILTDKVFFKGSVSFLNDIAKVKRVPLLRKDFIIDEYQIYEAKSNGADAILLISESLSANQIKELIHVATENDLEVLLELHSIEQLKKITFEEDFIVGINNRDLENFEVDLNTTLKIRNLIPDDRIIISESGIKSKEHIEFLKKSKVSAILVGEHLMISKDLKGALKDLKDWCRIES
jgi:indole-3-glycerol phosphate synthase